MKKFLQLTIFSIFLSILISLVCYIFGSVLIVFSKKAFDLSPYNLMLLPFVGIAIVYFKNKNKEYVDDSMKKVFDATQFNEKLSLFIVPFQILTTWFSHLSGASVGREGVALQLGGSISNYFSNKFSFDTKLFTSVGKAAGFSALFGTPLSGSFFAFEMNNHKIKNISFWYTAFLMTFSSAYITTKMGLSHFHFHIQQLIKFNWIIVIKLTIISIIFILVGNGFVLMLKSQRNLYNKIFKNEYIKIITLSIIFIIIMIILDGRYMSLGTNLIDMSFGDYTNVLNADFILKLILTTFIIAAGFQGGEVTPLFAIGATLGVFLAKIFNLPVFLIAALGYSSVFGNATKAYLSSFFICIEIFGIQTLPYIIFVTLINYIFANQISIYPIVKSKSYE